MTQAILLQSLTEIVAIGLLFSSPSQIKPVAPIVVEEKAVLEKKVLAAAAPIESAVHTVSSGETLQSIAKDRYGKESFWTILWNDNPSLLDPALLHAGDKLLLRNEMPQISEELKRSLPSPTPTLTPTPTETPPPAGGPAATTTSSLTSLPLDQIYQDAGSKFGVPWQILYGIHVVETGQRDGPVDSGFGPQGPMQFLPATFASYATDGNGDGATDINSAADAIYTAANYLARHGSVDDGLRSYGNIGESVKRHAASRGYAP